VQDETHKSKIDELIEEELSHILTLNSKLEEL